VVYVDLRGSGDSDRSKPEHWNLETWSEDLRPLCDVLGIDRPVVLGAGWGGFVVLRYAQRWPGHASKLVLTNPNARFAAPRSVARFDELGGAVVGEAAFEFFEHPNEQTIAEFLRICFPTMIVDGRASGLMMLSTWNLELALHWYGGERGRSTFAGSSAASPHRPSSQQARTTPGIRTSRSGRSRTASRARRSSSSRAPATQSFATRPTPSN